MPLQPETLKAAQELVGYWLLVLNDNRPRSKIDELTAFLMTGGAPATYNEKFIFNQLIAFGFIKREAQTDE